jgi:two-component system, OmpR family, sensor histidine kinase BaeS
MRPSIRRTWILAGVAALVAVILVACTAAIGLRRAHQLLTRTGFSQEQLTFATELEAGVNTYAARAALGVLHADMKRDEGRRIVTLLARYDASIRAERLLLIANHDSAADDEEAELATVRELGRLFARIRRDADAGPAIDRQDLSRDLDRFQALVQATVIQERQEVADAVSHFDRTRSIVRSMAILLPALSAVVGAIGLWWLLARLKRPLRRFGEAMAAVGRGETAPIGDLGFIEFDTLAAGFDRMAVEVEAQRSAVERANANLERTVALRTAELELRNAQLAEIEANRRQFFAQISHELRTPITALQCEAQVALRAARPDPEDLRQALQQIVVQGSLVRRRLSDLLAISQAEDGKLVMARASFDVAEALRGSIALADPFARASDARMDTKIGAGAFTVVGDAGWMQQALLALLDNAIKFSPEAVVSVVLARRAGEALLTIGDRGPGVPEAALDRLFDRFHQEPEGRARGGSGLGLSIARWVVDHHGGRIAAANQDGGGLRIAIALPLAS